LVAQLNPCGEQASKQASRLVGKMPMNAFQMGSARRVVVQNPPSTHGLVCVF